MRRKTNIKIDTPNTGQYGTVMSSTYAQWVLPAPGTVVKVKGEYVIRDQHAHSATWFYGVVADWDDEVFSKNHNNAYFFILMIFSISGQPLSSIQH